MKNVYLHIHFKVNKLLLGELCVMIFLAVFLLSILICGGCGQDQSSKVSGFDVSIPKSIEIGISNVENISKGLQLNNVVKLETIEESLIGNVDKIIVGNDGRIFILDAYVAQSVFVFDVNGRFLFKIHKLGHGPGEFVNLRDFEIDELTSTIRIFDAYNPKIIEYRISDGMYINERFINQHVHRFFTLNDSVTFFQAESESGYHIEIEQNQAAFDGYVENYQNPADPLPLMNGFQCNDSIVTFLPSEGLKIYQISPDSVFVKYQLTHKDDFSSNDGKNGEAGTVSVDFLKHFLINDFVLLHYQEDLKQIITLYNERTQKSVQEKFAKITPKNMLGWSLIFARGTTKKEFVTAIPSLIVRRISSYYNNYPDEDTPTQREIHKDILAIEKSVEETDNPILFFIEPKANGM